MSEFKISRLRYTWRGNWQTNIDYIKDDIIKFGGASWVCIRQHTSSAFADDQVFLENEANTDVSPAWKKMTDGYAWRNIWEPSELYSPGDIALYGGNLYLCVTSHTAGATFGENSDKWAVYAEGQTFREDWSQNTRYGINDIAKYNGIVYRCLEDHTSATTENGLELDQSKWEIFYEGTQYRGIWAVDVRYRVNDLVTFGGTVFRCKQGHTSGSDSTLNFDQDEHWEIEFPGFQFDNEWSPTTVYQVGDVVRHGGYLYYALTNSYGSSPGASIYQLEDRVDPIDWQILSKAINFRGTWSIAETYKTGDLVRRGGNLYIALLDTTADGSSLDYLDATNWELITVAQNWRNFWADDAHYFINDIVIFEGNAYQCNTEHESSNQNYPGDNGSGFFYWDLILQKGSDVGLKQRGDLTTYNLNRSLAGDGSSFGATNVEIGLENQLLTINNEDTIFYKDYGYVNRVVYVATTGVDDDHDVQRGQSPFKPWRTIRYACERVNDEFAGTTTIRVSSGVYEEILPIIIPARTVVLGTELRTTTIKPAGAIAALSLDSTYTIAVLSRLSQIIDSLLKGVDLVPAKSVGNSLDPVVVTEITGGVPFDPPRFNENLEEIFDPIRTPVEVSDQVVSDIRMLITHIRAYINYYINGIGNAPSMTGSNSATTDEFYLNAAAILDANKEFIAEESTAFMRANYPAYVFDEDACKRDVRRYVEAWIYDLTYTGNYKSLMAARYYRNAVLGSAGEDMFYCRDATGVRNCTLSGLTGTLPPVQESVSYRIPTGGAYISLDPGWGPNDTSTWINTRSPYIQGVTTFGNGAIGQKIDGALHAGGNRSIVSNDFTQVISDGIGAWVANNGRAELVSVFTYYAHVGYLATDGGIIRGTNGNNSYGDYGAVADGVDITETPLEATINNRNQQAIVASAFAGDFVDEIQILEWTNAGQNYSQASASFVGAGVGASVVFDDFRDDAIFEARLVDTSTTIVQTIGGSGYRIVQNNAQGGNPLTITLASNDPNTPDDYVGVRIVLTSGPGTGQYGYISAYDDVTKVATITRESDNQPGWDHVVPGKLSEALLTTGTTYRIEPRVTFADPGFVATEVEIPATTNWASIAYGNTTETYNNVAGSLGTGNAGEDDVTPAAARFNIIKEGQSYNVTIASAGAGYVVGDTITISGNNLGGLDLINDLIIQVTEISNDSTDSIVNFTASGVGASGRFVAITQGGSAAAYSSNGDDWTSFNMPSSGNWTCLAAGDNKFVAIRTGSNVAASSLDGKTWTTRSMPASRQWSAVTHAEGVFFAVARNLNAGAVSTNGTTWTSVTLPTAGDSTINEWVDIAYGKGRFVVLANSNNLVVAGTYNSITTDFDWDLYIMDTIDDSSQKDWVSIAYGNNRFVAIAATGEVSYSFNGAEWFAASMPTQDGSTTHNWKKIRYAQGVFFAVGDTGGRDIGADPTTGPTTFAATSFDGIVWTNRELSSEENWVNIAFGNPYIDSADSTVGKNTPMWIALADNSNKISKVRTGARALGRVTVTSGVISSIRLWDTGSGYVEPPTVEIFAPDNNVDARVECRLADGVLTNPSWLNRGLGYRTLSTSVTITGNGFADRIPQGKFITISNLPKYFGPGALITFNGENQRYTAVTVTELGLVDGTLSAYVRVSPEIKNRDNLEHNSSVSIRERYSQVRITGHDFLDVGTGNFETTNYPDLYTRLYQSAPENEILDEDGGRVFYTATDQNGNFKTGELFAVEQASGIVTISADFFDFSGLTELRLGGIRVGGTGAVIREFSTDPVFTEDSNNIVPTQRAIRAYLQRRLSVGGSEIAVGSFIAGTILVGPDLIRNVAGLKTIVPVRADFEGSEAGVSGSMLAQTMFYKSF